MQAAAFSLLLCLAHWLICENNDSVCRTNVSLELEAEDTQKVEAAARQRPRLWGQMGPRQDLLLLLLPPVGTVAAVGFPLLTAELTVVVSVSHYSSLVWPSAVE